jgi:hypothetical protein
MLIDDIQMQLQQVTQWRMEFVCREGNQAAHNLAKMAVKDDVNYQWVFVTPECIVDIVKMEHIDLPLRE